MSPSNWPKHKIILDRGTGMNPIPYILATGYGDSSTTITIHDSQAALPNYYVKTEVSAWTIYNGSMSFTVNITL